MRHFVTKDMGEPKYFLGTEVAHQKYIYFFHNLSMSGSSGGDMTFGGANQLPMEANVDLWLDMSHTLDDPGRFRRLIGKLIYLTVAKPDNLCCWGTE